METLVGLILSSRAAWAVENDTDVAENVRTSFMMTRKSRVDIEIYCGGDTVVLDLTTSARVVVLRAEGFGGVEDTRVVGNGVVEAGSGSEDNGT